MPLFRQARPREKEFPLKTDVLNYSPAAYQIPRAWTAFLGSVEGEMKKALDRTSPDDLNGDMFDSLIEAAALEVRTAALRQKTEHLHTIRHNQKVLLGELAEVRVLRRDLNGALNEVIRQLAGCGVRTAEQNHCKEESE